MKVSELIEALQEIRYQEAPVVLVLGTHGLEREIGRLDILHIDGTRIQIVAGKPK